MVTTFSLLLVNFGLNGFTEAIIQRDDIDHSLASNLFWINLGAGILLTAAFAGAGSLLAWFYHDQQVAHVAVGISLTIVLTSVSVLHLALLKRAMLFSVVSLNDITARGVSVAVSILLGWLGCGYWALIAGAIAMPLSVAVGAWSACRWIPSLPRRVAGTGPTLWYAFHTYGRFTLNYVARNTDNLLVGWKFNAQALGFYKKAYDLFALPASQLVSSVTVVAVASLSRLNRDREKYQSSLVRALAVIAFVGMALSADLTLVGKDVIRVLLGPGWEEAGRLFTFFGPGIGVMMVYHSSGWIHLSIGRADRWLRWGVVELAVTCLLFLVGLPWGPTGIAVAWTVSFWLLTIPAMWYAARPIGLRVGPLLSTVWRYVIAALVAGTLTALMVRRIPYLLSATGLSGAMLRIVCVSLLLSGMYLAAVALLHGSFDSIFQVTLILQEMILWRKLKLAPAAQGIFDIREQGSDLQNEKTAKDDHQPLVSILIPAHNAETSIAETLRSAITQTWPRKEIIVVDDGSTDSTLAVARQFEVQSVRVVTQENQGASGTRNKAFSLSNGDYIQWLDADDLLAPDKIATQLDAIGRQPGSRELLSSAWGLFMYRRSRAKFIRTPLWCDLSPTEWLLRKMGQNLFMQTATWLVSRELTLAAGPWDTRLSSDDDGEYFCRVLLASEGVRFVPQAKVFYRGPGLAFGGLSHIGRSMRKIDAHWLSMQLHVKYLCSLEDSERVRAACLRYLQTSLIIFYPESERIVQQVERSARNLGGQLSPPILSWKYSWMKAIFGWRLAKYGQQTLLTLRWSLQRNWDKGLSRIDSLRNWGNRGVGVCSLDADRQVADKLKSRSGDQHPVVT